MAGGGEEVLVPVGGLPVQVRDDPPLRYGTGDVEKGEGGLGDTAAGEGGGLVFLQPLGSFLLLGRCVLHGELDVWVKLVYVSEELVKLFNCATKDSKDVI